MTYSLVDETIIREINLFLSMGSIVPCFLLFYRVSVGGSRARVVRFIMAWIFLAFGITSLMGSLISLNLLMGGEVEKILPLSNWRNLIKNSAIFAMAWTFLFIEFRSITSGNKVEDTHIDAQQVDVQGLKVTVKKGGK